MKIYVGNLIRTFTEDDLNNLFSNYGEVTSVKIILDRATGVSRGFGFVEMTSEDEGQKAIDELNGKEIEGRSIVVNKARPQEKREGGGGGGRGRFNNRGGGGGRFNRNDRY